MVTDAAFGHPGDGEWIAIEVRDELKQAIFDYDKVVNLVALPLDQGALLVELSSEPIVYLVELLDRDAIQEINLFGNSEEEGLAVIFVRTDLLYQQFLKVVDLVQQVVESVLVNYG